MGDTEPTVAETTFDPSTPMIPTDDTNHGSAFVLLTGTQDWSYTVDTLITGGFLEDEDKSDLMITRDGYRLRYMMVGMKAPLENADDTEAICLYSETAGGALCGGIRQSGTQLVEFGLWVPAGSFILSVDSGLDLTLTGTDNTIEWTIQGVDGGNSILADGSNDSYWSVFKF